MKDCLIAMVLKQSILFAKYRAVTKGDYKTAEDLIADFKSPLRAE